MLTLEAAVDDLDSDFRPMDFMKEIFKSTPNLNRDGIRRGAVSTPPGIVSGSIPIPSGAFGHLPSSHMRSTSYSVSYGTKKVLPGSPTAHHACERGNDIPLKTVFPQKDGLPFLGFKF